MRETRGLAVPSVQRSQGIFGSAMRLMDAAIYPVEALRVNTFRLFSHNSKAEHHHLILGYLTLYTSKGLIHDPVWLFYPKQNTDTFTRCILYEP